MNQVRLLALTFVVAISLCGSALEVEPDSSFYPLLVFNDISLEKSLYVIERAHHITSSKQQS